MTAFSAVHPACDKQKQRRRIRPGRREQSGGKVTLRIGLRKFKELARSYPAKRSKRIEAVSFVWPPRQPPAAYQPHNKKNEHQHGTTSQSTRQPHRKPNRHRNAVLCPAGRYLLDELHRPDSIRPRPSWARFLRV